MDTQEAGIFNVVLIISVTMGIIIAYFIISIIRQQRRNLQLQKRSMQAEITAMEKERARIAADLHDDLGPVLSVIKFQVDNIETIQGEEKDQLNDASNNLDHLVSRTREIANNLMPSALYRKGLVTAVEEFISRIGKAANLRIKFTYPPDLVLNNEMSINVYRALQEVVHNCIKHSGASQLEIEITTKKKMIMILCRDNGKGFDPAKKLRESSGIGLNSLKNRTEMMNGTLSIESKEGKGSVFLFEIPT